MVGTVIGNYKLLQMIGAGGMGTVYEAVQQPIGRRVAIKVLHPEFAHDRDVLKRFFNEARAANLINHPSIVQVSDYGQLPNGSAYLAMEYLDGFTLDDHVIAAGGKISPDQAQHIAWQLASALSAAHTAGIVHRDLKPSNIMLIQDAIMPGGVRVKILDFGVAKLGLSAGVSSHKTRTGAVLGTPTYMAPEQWKNLKQIDGKVDVYALGLIAFLGLTGRPPFMAEEMRAHGARLVVEIADPLPQVALDAGQLRQALLNLLRNAREAMPKGGTLTLTACPAASEAPESPAVRITWSAQIGVPDGLVAVMSGNQRRVDGAVTHCAMDKPVPPYLIALACGDLVERDHYLRAGAGELRRAADARRLARLLAPQIGALAAPLAKSGYGTYLQRLLESR